MTKLILQVLNCMVGIIMIILIAGIPVVMGIAALAALWRWLGI